MRRAVILVAIRVVRAWDPKARVFIDAKTEAGQNRAVLIVDRLGVPLRERSAVILPGLESAS